MLFRIVLNVFLLALCFVAALVPARHGWRPLWPTELVEVVYADPAGEIRMRLLEPVEKSADGQWIMRRDGAEIETVRLNTNGIQAVSRPASAVVVEDHHGARYFGYLAGVRESADGPLLDTSENLIGEDLIGADYVNYHDETASRRLVFQYPDGEVVEFESVSLRYAYRPNRMGRADKFHLLMARMRDKWSEE